MTDAELARLDELASRATPGPWRDDGPDKFAADEPWTHVVTAPSNNILAQVDCDFPAHQSHLPGYEGCEQARADVAFIAAARDAIPALVAEVRRLRAELAARPAWDALPPAPDPMVYELYPVTEV